MSRLMSSLRRGAVLRHFAAVVGMLIGVFLPACDTSWEADTTRYLQEGKASAALARLQAVQEEERSTTWYILASHANTALFKGSGEVKFKTAALDTIDKGIERFPDAARMRLEKAFFLLSNGDREGAEEWLHAAVRLAEAHLQRQPGGNEAEIDRGVLAHAKFLEEELAKQ